MSKKERIRLHIIIPLTCDTCGKPIALNEPKFLLFGKFCHVKCGYNN